MSRLRETALHHLYAGKARMIEFNGWDMPVWFSSIEKEHLAVRNAAGVFDISHMNRTDIEGADAEKLLEYACDAGISGLGTGDMRYTHMLNENGGIIDDGIVFRLEDEHFLFVTNACTETRVNHWLARLVSAGNYQARLRHEGPDRAMIAVQGPRAAQALHAILGTDIQELGRFKFVIRDSLIVSRSGYTGEDGAELIGSGPAVGEVFERLLGSGVEPCGLGARDTLRLEMGYPLGCVDVTEEVTPLEMGAEKLIDFSKDFVGKSAIVGKVATRRFRGVLTDQPAVLRGGSEVLSGGRKVGVLTSGTLSPVLKRGIGMGFFPADLQPGSELTVNLRGRLLGASLTKPPFIRKQ